MIHAVDFDAVIHDRNNREVGRRMGKPIEGAKEAIIELKRRGDTVIVHCLWAHGSGVKVIRDWMTYHEIPFDDVTNVKPQADVYLDDKAIRFVDWKSYLEYVAGRSR